ncbi:hypothetical protein RUM44_010013 [Polyplax serrata]|uniref:Hexosyltransferase n=1 Tax=Polyplax serrata TaxID=468196 RepID=A0ABR1AUD5_POLSC
MFNLLKLAARVSESFKFSWRYLGSCSFYYAGLHPYLFARETMYFIFKLLRITIQNNFFLIFGIFLGVGLSSIISQLIQNSCFFASQTDYPSKYVSSSVIEEDYEPVINLAGKPQKAQKTPQEFVRPRYYRTELGIRDKLLTAVLTSPNSILEYGVSFNKTTNHLFDKVVFFMESEGKKAKRNDRFNGVVQFSDSRTVLKPFHLLKYLSDNFLDDYDYFFIVRDTTYIRGRLLNYIISKISVSVDVHLGGAKEDAVANYCSIDSGILISNLVLKKVAQNLDWCVKNAFSESDDANLGRCIFHSTSKACATEFRGLQLSSYTITDNEDNVNIEKLSEDAAFENALSFWPMPSPAVMFMFHIYFTELEIFKKKLETSEVQDRIINEPVILSDNKTMEIPWPIGSPASVKPLNRFDVLRWDYFTEYKIYLKSDFNNVDELKGADLLDVKYVINASINFVQEEYKGQLQYLKLVNGYRRFDSTRGMDYILDMDFKDEATQKNVHKRLEICKRLGPVELVPVPYVTENTRVNMILAVGEANKQEVLKFMENYMTVCMEKKDKTFLMLVLLYEARHPKKGSKNDIFGDVKAQAIKYSEKFKKEGNKISWLSIKLPNEYISPPLIKTEERRVALNNGILTVAIFDLVIKKFSLDNLILYCSSNMEIRQDYLNRVRMNTIKDSQVFSPIPFSEFHPSVVYSDELIRPKEMDINKNYGHYDTLNNDHISFYVKDYREARKKIEHVIPTVVDDKGLAQLPYLLSKEFNKNRDQNLDFLLGQNFAGSQVAEDSFIKALVKISLHSVYGLFFNLENINILRAVEPGLRLRHVEVDCKKITHPDDLLKSKLFQQCIEKRNFNTGMRSQLGGFILDHMNKKKPK